MDPEELRVRQETLRKLRENPEAYLAEYTGKFGNVLNADVQPRCSMNTTRIGRATGLPCTLPPHGFVTNCSVGRSPKRFQKAEIVSSSRLAEMPRGRVRLSRSPRTDRAHKLSLIRLSAIQNMPEVCWIGHWQRISGSRFCTSIVLWKTHFTECWSVPGAKREWCPSAS